MTNTTPRLARVELAFENCDSLTIPTDDIVYIRIAGITDGIDVWGKEKSIERYHYADTVCLEIRNKPEYHRILDYNDIAQIHLYDDSGNHEWYFVDYDEDVTEDNRYQRTNVSESFKLIVVTITKENAKEAETHAAR